MNALKCPTCKFPLAVSPHEPDRASTEPITCWACRVLAAATETESLHQTNIEARRQFILTRNWLDKGGVPPRLREEASMRGIPDAIRKALAPHLTPIRDGLPLTHGLGLMGGIGCRKSGSLVALLKLYSITRARRIVGDGDQWTKLPTRPVNFRWVDWPLMYPEIARSGKDPSGVNHLLRRFQDAELLVLDDLGREPLPRKADDDSTPYAMGFLQEVITFRNSNMLPIWWTSNLTLSGLSAIYDGSTIDRLLEDNLPIMLPGLPNYRLPAQYQ